MGAQDDLGGKVTRAPVNKIDIKMTLCVHVTSVMSSVEQAQASYRTGSRKIHFMLHTNNGSHWSLARDSKDQDSLSTVCVHMLLYIPNGKLDYFPTLCHVVQTVVM